MSTRTTSPTAAKEATTAMTMETMATMVGRTTDSHLTTHCSAATTRRGRRAGMTKTARTRVTTTTEERAGVGCMLH